MDKLRSFYFSLPPLIRNKYVLTGLVFSIWMTFFDSNNLILQMQRRSRVYELEQQKHFYHAEIEANQEALDALLSNPENVERFAREQYLMKKENEEIFILVEE